MAKRKNPAAVALGRLGGKKTSHRKTEAARKNARKPRPGRRRRAPSSDGSAKADERALRDAGLWIGRRRPMVEDLERLSADLDRVVAPVLARLRKRTA
jgi:hypothetical protein